MDEDGLKRVERHTDKRRRIDSGLGGQSGSSGVNSPVLSRRDTQTSSGMTACSPILLSDDHDLDIFITETTKPSSSEPKVTIYLGTTLQHVPQSKFLQHVWKNGLDSACMVCHQGFDIDANDPPIRTFTFEESCQSMVGGQIDITQTAIAPHPVRVINRHLACIRKKRITYIPVSHVWHEAVSTAQLNHDGDLEAARISYQVPVQILTALTKRLGAVEVWHDYLSVPQWQQNIQQQLLLKIPIIFSYPKQMMVHLDDVQPSCLRDVEDPPDYIRYIDGISKLSKSRWFDRMWVALEYIQGNEVLIISQYFDVFGTMAAELLDTAGLHLGKFVKRLGQDRFNQLASAKGFEWTKRACWDDMETWKKLDFRYRTLGAAIFIIGQKNCRDYHDYFFALRGLLDLGQTQNEVTTIFSNDIFGSYLDLAWDALQSGDYSPLLFIPLENESVDIRAPWLRGYEKLSQKLWDLGICRSLAKHQNIIRDSAIQPRLDSIGTFEDFEYYSFGGSSDSVAQHIFLKILELSGPVLPLFLAAIERIFPRPSSKGLLGPDVASGDAGDMTHSPDELDRITSILARLSDTSKNDKKSPEVSQLSRKLLALLQLDLPDKQSHVSRIKTARNEAEFYGSNMEGLASVRCKSCLQTFLFRVTAWELPGSPSELYRIPGLLYDDTVPEGVGLVFSRGRIVGRACYAPPACDCRVSEFVELGRRP